MAAIYGVIVHWIMAKQTCVAAHSTDAEIRAYFSGVQLNKYLRCVQTFLRHDMSKPTIIYEDNQAALDIMAAGHITSRVKHMAVPIAICHEDIKEGNSVGEKILGILNPADLGTKPLPSSSYHRQSRQLRGQRYYPAPGTLHYELLQVNLVNQRINEVENGKSDGLVNIHAFRTMTSAISDNKNQVKLDPQLKHAPK